MERLTEWEMANPARGDLMYVVVLAADKPRPKYHRLGWGGNLDMTLCGWTQSGYWDRPILPLRHAKKFADPCKECFRHGNWMPERW